MGQIDLELGTLGWSVSAGTTRPLVGLVVGRIGNQLQRFGTRIAGRGRKDGTHFRTREQAGLVGSQVEDLESHNQHLQGNMCGEGKSLGSNQAVEKMTLGTQEVLDFLVRTLVEELVWNISRPQCRQDCSEEQRLRSLDRSLAQSCETWNSNICI